MIPYTSGGTLYEPITEIGKYTIIKRNATFEPWVCAWKFNLAERSWAQGHYFSTAIKAVLYAIKETDPREIVNAMLSVCDSMDDPDGLMEEAEDVLTEIAARLTEV